MSTPQKAPRRPRQHHANFELVSDFKPQGDQPEAIKSLVTGLRQGLPHQVLLGVTGSGKSFTMANVIAEMNRPSLVLAPNKTLAAQLFAEFKAYFPNNAVEYFVSYYDYYQPEAYVASSDTYIEKDSAINERIDKLRHSATRSLLERRDVLIVASVSCIYGLGSPEAYSGMLVNLSVGQEGVKRDAVLAKLVEMQYTRNDISFHRGTFRVRGDSIEVYPAYEDDKAIRIELWGDEVEAISEIDPLRGRVLRPMDKCAIYPASHYVTQAETQQRAVETISAELESRLAELRGRGLLLEAQRLEQRTNFDLEMLEEMGYCNGIENYSSHLTGRPDGEPPPCLLDFFSEDWLLFADESHISIPQVRAMYRGDRARKTNLVEHGFRLPSALNNRPLKFEEFEEMLNQVIYVSATPGDYEMEASGGVVVEQIIRPTGLLDPVIEVRPVSGQVDDLLGEVRERAARDERVLVTTLTKRMAEDLTTYFADLGVRVRYLHSDIDTLERIQIIQDLRLGEFDVLIGINLLREGLDLPEVSLVAILDADKEGFLRSPRSLIQTVGRAARNAEGVVIFYADSVTKSMAQALEETNRRREVQNAHNEEMGITPETVRKSVENQLLHIYGDDGDQEPSKTKKGKRNKDGRATGKAGSKGSKAAKPGATLDYMSAHELEGEIRRLRKEMLAAAADLKFEEAADIRDRLKIMEDAMIAFG